MSKVFMAIAIGAAALAALAAGCGGSDDSSETTAALTKAEFIKQADAICVKGNEATEAEVEEFAEENDVNLDKPTREQQEQVISEVVAPGTRQEIEDIAELSAPSGDEAEIEAMIESVETGAGELEDEPGLLLDEKNPLDEGSKLANSYGLKECGQQE